MLQLALRIGIQTLETTIVVFTAICSGCRVFTAAVWIIFQIVELFLRVRLAAPVNLDPCVQALFTFVVYGRVIIRGFNRVRF